MHDVYNNVTPSKISNLFTFTSEIHTYNTRSISSEMYHRTKEIFKNKPETMYWSESLELHSTQNT